MLLNSFVTEIRVHCRKLESTEKLKKKKNWVAQVVEHLPSKSEFKPQYHQRKKEKIIRKYQKQKENVITTQR
jgi:hypothetical protein